MRSICFCKERLKKSGLGVLFAQEARFRKVKISLKLEMLTAKAGDTLMHFWPWGVWGNHRDNPRGPQLELRRPNVIQLKSTPFNPSSACSPG